MASLAEIRARLQAKEGNNNSQSSGGDNAIYPHWNIQEGESCTLRFLPDGDPNNTFFWAERLMIKLPFSGIKGEMDSKPVIVNVPCVEMWQEACPVLAEVRTWFKDSSLEDMGRKYWKKRSYVFQGFVRENPLQEDSPTNPIRRFIIGPQLFAPIKDALMDPELEELPTDYTAGLDFVIKKTSKGGYADYSTSKWARKETALTEAEQAAIEQHGLYNLSDFLPKKPSETELQIIKQMFEDSVDGQPYDPEKYGQYYRPAGMAPPAGAVAPTVAPANTPQSAPLPEVKNTAPADDTPPFDVDEKPASTPVASNTEAKPSGDRAQDILAMIRSRQSQG
jgi:hypothetical protein